MYNVERVKLFVSLFHFANVEKGFLENMSIKKYLLKFLLSLLVVFTPVFMLLIFGPTEIFFGNYNELGFVYGEFGIEFIKAAAIISLIGALFISVMPNVLYKGFLAIIAGITVASYIQTMFLNKGIGLIGVTAEGYIPTTAEIITNLLVWGIIIAGCLVIAYHNKVSERKIFGMISGILLAVQMIGFGSLFLTAEDKAFAYPEGELCLNVEEQLTVSSGENVIILLFDNVSNVWLDDAISVYPDLLNCVKDFTYYTNADCNMYGTYPSVAHILTGHPLDVTLSINDYLAECWDNPMTNAFYDLLAEKNYKVNIFTKWAEDIIGGNSLEILDGKVSNVIEQNDMAMINYELLYETMLEMSLFRYVPNIVKPDFYVNNEQYGKIVTYPENEILHSNPNFYNKLVEEGITVSDDSNYFVFNHLNGAHEFINDENCQYAEDPTRDQTIKGMFVLVEEYLNQLKQANVYDSATIIIMTDHGVSYNAQPMFLFKAPYQTNENVSRTNAPITYEELIPTIVDCMKEDSSAFGKTFYDFKEGELRERVFYDRAYHGEHPDVMHYTGTRAGSANVWKKYTYTGDRYVIMGQYDNAIFEVIPMVDCYY